MSVDEVIAGLGELGFSPYEARVYHALLQRSPMNGHEIGKRSTVPTSKVYETLERLRGKGAVRVYESDPVRYAPVPYRDLLSAYSDRMRRTIDTVSRILAPIAMDTDTRLTWSMTGARHAVDALRSAVRHATAHVAVLIGDPEAEELADDLRAASDRGVEVVRVLGGTGPNGRRLCLAVGDRTETVVVCTDAHGDTTGVWTHNDAITLLALSRVEQADAAG